MRTPDGITRAEALQDAVLHIGSLSVVATDATGMIKIFTVGAQRRLGYRDVDVVDKVTPAAFADSAELRERAARLSLGSTP